MAGGAIHAAAPERSGTCGRAPTIASPRTTTRRTRPQRGRSYSDPEPVALAASRMRRASFSDRDHGRHPLVNDHPFSSSHTKTDSMAQYLLPLSKSATCAPTPASASARSHVELFGRHDLWEHSRWPLSHVESPSQVLPTIQRIDLDTAELVGVPTGVCRLAPQESSRQRLAPWRTPIPSRTPARKPLLALGRAIPRAERPWQRRPRGAHRACICPDAAPRGRRLSGTARRAAPGRGRSNAQRV